MTSSKPIVLAACMAVLLVWTLQAGEIHDTVKSKDLDGLQRLLEIDKGRLVHDRAKGGSTPLHWAAVCLSP
ncbi:MAG: hypothetical protein O3A51_03805, partial [Verrucomicrobia bacterium]|nr:hypothetical protein [Verrucomicrobiota bacterium]